MDTTEVHDGSASSASEDDLRSWDWRAELKRQERQVTWLARHTDRAATTVHKYASGEIPTPLSWLREAEIVLGRGR
jgi:hypothetical protein